MGLACVAYQRNERRKRLYSRYRRDDAPAAVGGASNAKGGGISAGRGGSGSGSGDGNIGASNTGADADASFVGRPAMGRAIAGRTASSASASAGGLRSLPLPVPDASAASRSEEGVVFATPRAATPRTATAASVSSWGARGAADAAYGTAAAGAPSPPIDLEALSVSLTVGLDDRTRASVAKATSAAVKGIGAARSPPPLTPRRR